MSSIGLERITEVNSFEEVQELIQTRIQDPEINVKNWQIMPYCFISFKNKNMDIDIQTEYGVEVYIEYEKL